MSLRTEKVNEQIKVILADIIQRRYGASYGLCSIIGAKTTPDLKSCRVLVSSMGDGQEFVKKIITDKWIIRKELAGKIQMKFVPELFFELDTTLKEATRIEELLKKIR